MNPIIVYSSPRWQFPVATINPQLRRLSLNQHAWNMLVREYGRETLFVQLLTDESDEGKNLIWLRLCDSNSWGCRKLDSTSTKTRSFKIPPLLMEMILPITETTQYPIIWDAAVGAGLIDLGKPLSEATFEEVDREIDSKI